MKQELFYPSLKSGVSSYIISYEGEEKFISLQSTILPKEGDTLLVDCIDDKADYRIHKFIIKNMMDGQDGFKLISKKIEIEKVESIREANRNDYVNFYNKWKERGIEIEKIWDKPI